MEIFGYFVFAFVFMMVGAGLNHWLLRNLIGPTRAHLLNEWINDGIREHNGPI